MLMASIEEQVGSSEEDDAGVDYPLRVDYCGLCTMPPEVIFSPYGFNVPSLY